MATEWISPTWRMPENSNQNKVDNYSLEFDSSAGEYIDLGSPSELDFETGEMTLSCWINSETVSSIKPILGNSNSGASSYQYLLDVNRTAGKISFLSSGITTLVSNLTITADTWYHICITKSGTTSNWVYTMYVNGSSTDGDTLSTSTNPPATQTVAIGKYGALGGLFFQGKISNFCAFNEALTSGQVSALYNSGTPINPMALTPLPVAYYPLGGSSTGSASTLTVPNESVADATVFNFDGSDDYVNLNTTLSSLGVTTSFSISTWVNISTLGIYDTVIGAPAAYSTWNDGFGLIVYNNALYFWVEDWNDANHFVQTATLNTSQWYHIVCTFSTSNGLKIYVDSDTPTTASNTEIGTLTFPMFIGSTGTNTTYVFNGEISNTQIWNTELSASDVTTLYNSGVPLYTGTQPQAANLKAWYPMNVENANWLGSDWQIAEATSAYPQSFDFDGSSDEIVVSDDAALQIDGDITISAWIYAESDTGRVVSKRGGGGTNYDFYIESRYLRLYDGGTGPFSSGRITLNEWTHILISVTSGTGTYYINNVAAGTGTFSISSVGTSQPFFIGGAYTPVLANFDGKMSNVQIWDTGLDTSQVETLYNNGSPLTTAIASSNLKAWYKLDNSATFSTNWSIPDASGNGNTGTSSGMTEQNLVNNNVSVLNGTSSGMTTANLVNSDLTRSIPYSSYSMDFDGTADYIDCGAGFQYSDLTISGWFYADSISTFRRIIQLGRSSGGIGFGVAWENSSKLIAFWNNGTETVRLGNTSLSTGNWYHFAMTRNSTEVKIYVNGSDDSGTGGQTGWGSSNNNLELGRKDGGGQYMDGKLSNVAIWNSVLTDDQILTIYNGGVPNSISSLSPVSWWSLAGDSYYNGTNWICPDLGSGGNNGTSSGMGGSELVGNGPGSSANGTATSMDIPANLKGDAPNSSNNAFSVNMDTADRVADVPA